MDYRIIAIYDADFSVLGEITYALGKLTQTRSCALCDISHGLNPLGKRTWRVYRDLHTDIEWLHRNDIATAQLKALPIGLPCVVMSTNEGKLIPLLSKEDLDACHGEVAIFDQKLSARLEQTNASCGVARAS
uniref:Uncharacterized protein n=1 Tax=uncultured marine bacterium 443 TaxID=257393 RepID=Q6SGX2_9BACT|nr:hypothetical protein MBMO_EBAC000-65D02.42 [uncultured marine bacterium 443]